MAAEVRAVVVRGGGPSPPAPLPRAGEGSLGSRGSRGGGPWRRALTPCPAPASGRGESWRPRFARWWSVAAGPHPLPHSRGRERGVRVVDWTVMDSWFARVSKAGRVVCGKQHADGGFYCDEPIAAFITRVREASRYPERRLVVLPGWRLDRKGIWRRTTSVEDRRAHGRATTEERAASPELPALACCAKCGTLQWLEAERLGVGSKRPAAGGAGGRWLIREPAPEDSGRRAQLRRSRGGG